MRWAETAARQPTLGAVAHDRLIKPGALLVGTTRRDGSARISGVEPLVMNGEPVMNGELWLSMMQTSAKAHDLHRDPRILLHSLVTGPEAAAEIKVRGTARVEADGEVNEQYATAAAAELGGSPWPGASRCSPSTSRT